MLMMENRLADLIWDQIANAHDFTAHVVKRQDDGGVSYRVSLVIDLPADVEKRLEEDTLKNNSGGITKRLRNYVKLGLRVCFGDEHE